MVVFDPSGRIQRVVGDELEIAGNRYRSGDYPHRIKFNLGPPDRDQSFSVSGSPMRELTYLKYHLAVRLRRGHQDRIVDFVLDADTESLYLW